MPAIASSLTAFAFAPGALNTGYAACAHRIDRNIVGARTGSTDRRDRVGDIHVMHILRSQQNRIGMCDFRRHFIAFAR